MGFFRKRKLKKQLKTLLKQSKSLILGHEDILPEGDLVALRSDWDTAKAAYRKGDEDEIDRSTSALQSTVSRIFPPKPLAGLRENFDVLVVAVSVAMAFRAYFYQPFKIPTGSMQPTLYGIHAEPVAPEKRTALDVQPFKFAKWLITGESFHWVQAKAPGTARIMPNAQGGKPGYVMVVVGGQPHYVPSDMLEQSPKSGVLRLKGGIKNGDYLHAGDTIWSGIVHSGDFVFVNRWLWNFRHPQRGEVMVFATTGINGLQQGTHYIKRMMGMPNETLQIEPPFFIADGEPILTPKRIEQIAAKEKPWEKSPAYAGFNPNTTNDHRYPQAIGNSDDIVKLGPLQYYAMGDNSMNSYDSRYWGSVPERNLLGPAKYVYWPFTSPRFGKIE